MKLGPGLTNPSASIVKYILCELFNSYSTISYPILHCVGSEYRKWCKARYLHPFALTECLHENVIRSKCKEQLVVPSLAVNKEIIAGPLLKKTQMPDTGDKTFGTICQMITQAIKKMR